MRLRSRTPKQMPPDAHGIWDGVVGCPYVGRDVDFATACLSCHRLKELGLEAEQPWLRCRPALHENPLLVPWGF